MRERLAMESGRLAAMATGEARGSRVGVASGGRERHLVPCAIGVWGGLWNSLERGRRAACASERCEMEKHYDPTANNLR